jgi:pyruvate/2-oxoglutarate dehydrogenase complex dihydrolipoamide dehydrogenase (E3) component
MENVDVVVIGLGAAGESVAGQLAEAGLNVVGIEASLVGGECPYWGCIPSKMMIRAANALAEVRRVDGLAGKASATPDWGTVARRIREEATATWDDTVAVDRFVGKGGTFVRGYAKITGPNTVEVDGETYVAERGIVVATGTLAQVPPIPGLVDSPYWTNHEIIQTEVLPETMVVIGGGAIGAELGQVMSRFGVKVSVIEGTDHLLPQNEPEAGEVLREVFEAEGIEVYLGQFARSLTYEDGQFNVTLANDKHVSAEKLLVATGRSTFLKELGVANLGVDDGVPFLDVDENMLVQDGLWAVGDISGQGMFTHLGARQADVAVAHILGRKVEPLNLDALPSVTFTDPEVGAVGISALEAMEAGIDAKTVLKIVGHTARGWLHQAGNEGFIKLVIDSERNILVGATSVGPHGGEVLGLLALAVHAKIPISTLRSMIYAYPTFHKGIEDALNEL